MLAMTSNRLFSSPEPLTSDPAAETAAALPVEEVRYEDELEPLRAVDREDPMSRDSEAGRRARMGSRYAFVSQDYGSSGTQRSTSGCNRSAVVLRIMFCRSRTTNP